MIKSIQKILGITIVAILIAGSVNAYISQYWKTVDDLIPRTDKAVNIGNATKRVNEIWTDDAIITDSASIGHTLKIASGSITDSTGDISFGDENIDTTGSIHIDSDSSTLILGDDATDYTIGWDGSDAVHTITAGDFVFTGGSVGIGMTDPDALVEIKGTGRVFSIKDGSDDSELMYIDQSETYSIIFNDKVIMKDSFKSEAGGTSYYQGNRIDSYAGFFNIESHSGSMSFITHLADDPLKFKTKLASDIIFFTNDNERMKITSAGYVGIGDTSPDSMLEVVSAGDDYFMISSHHTEDGNILIVDSSGDMILGNGDLFVRSDNNIYLGTDNDASITYDDTDLWIDTDEVGTGSLKIGDATNYMEVKTDGELRLHGTARVKRHLYIWSPALQKKGNADPDAGWEGLFATYDFDKTIEQELYYTMNVPYRWDNTTDINFNILWEHETNQADADKKVVWGIEYMAIAEGEVLDGATSTTTEASAGSHNVDAGKRVDTIFTTGIPSSGLAPHGQAGLRIYRDADSGDDDLDEDVKMIGVHIEFTQNKLGKEL